MELLLIAFCATLILMYLFAVMKLIKENKKLKKESVRNYRQAYNENEKL